MVETKRRGNRIDEIKLCLQVLDAGDSSESFPGNRLNLVFTEVSGGGAEMEDGDVRPGVQKKHNK